MRDTAKLKLWAMSFMRSPSQTKSSKQVYYDRITRIAQMICAGLIAK